MVLSYGRRPKSQPTSGGVRNPAPTFGKQAHFSHAPRSQGTLLLDGHAERLTAQILGFDPNVKSFQSQPFSVDLVTGDILRSKEEVKAARARHKDRPGPIIYTPDFLVMRPDPLREVLEVKTDAFLGDEEYQLKLELARRILWERGFLFSRVVMPTYWRHPLLTNVPLIHQARLRKDLRPSDEMVTRIEQLSLDGAQTVHDFCRGIQISPSLIPILIGFGVLFVDIMSNFICGDTPASAAHGGLDHLSLLGRLVQ